MIDEEYEDDLAEVNIESDATIHDYTSEYEDYISKISNSLPHSVGSWLNKGSKEKRFLKLLTLVATLVIVVVAIFGLIATVTILYNLTDSGATEDTTFAPSDRLPDFAYPLAYNLTLTPDLINFNFTGFLTIDFQLKQKSKYIAIHADESLRIRDSIDYTTDESIFVKETGNYPDYQVLYIQFSEELSPNKTHQIAISYTGIIQDNMRGFYRSVYIGSDGQEHWLASTQFESTDARLAFPCFDEPSFKATFIITLIYEPSSASMVALSNMPEESRVPIGNKISVTFRQTPIMSTYLVAFLVGEFSSVEGTYNGVDKTVPVQVWAPTGQQEHGRVALNVTIGALGFYERFFNQPYTLPKLDLIAIPDFDAGAMENWGLITFRLTALLFNVEEDSAKNIQRVATVVTHELAHQWTGDLVTTGWWSDLWLNEGFAEFFELESVNFLYPEWDLLTQAIVEDQQYALGVDSLLSSPAIVRPADTAGQINDMFDTITYSKGASVIRMLQHYIGTEVFENSMQHYIEAHLFSNTFTKDLLSVFSEVSQKNIEEQFYNWVYEPGFPIIDVKLSNDKKTATLTQSRFLSSTENQVVSDNATTSEVTWWIYSEYVINSPSNVANTLFNTTTSAIISSSDISYIKLNWGSHGYFRVNYPTSVWNNLRSQIGQFPASDRANLVNDALVLARANKLPTAVALDFCSFLQNETDYTVWIAALSELSYIGTMLSTEYYYGSYQNFVQQLISTVVEYVGWATLSDNVVADHNQALLRSTILKYAVKYQVIEIMDVAYFEIWLPFRENGTYIAPDDREAVYCAALKYGTETDYWFLLSVLNRTDNASEQRRLISALGCPNQYFLLKHSLDISMDPAIIRPQDQSAVLSAVGANPLGRDLAWNFVQANWNTFNTLGFGVSRVIEATTQDFNDVFHLNQVKTFFEDNPAEGAASVMEESIEYIKQNIIWVANNSDPLSRFLSSYASPV